MYLYPKWMMFQEVKNCNDFLTVFIQSKQPTCIILMMQQNKANRLGKWISVLIVALFAFVVDFALA